MSRKETIIVAALVNAALLMILFISALKTKQPQENTSNPQVAVLEEKHVDMPVKQEISLSGGDEVDQVLSQFTHAAAPPSTTPSPLQELPPTAPYSQPSYAATAGEPPLTMYEQKPAIEPQVVEITVKKGDALEKIARTHQTTVAEIMKFNHLPSTRLRIGQVLKIKPGQKALSKIATPASNLEQGATPSMRYYTVRHGDNPWTIAVKNHMKLEDLLRLNNLDEEKARRLKPGDQIRIQ